MVAESGRKTLSYPLDKARGPRIFPDERVLQQVNYTEDMDWPLLLYSHGRCCGMSVAQASHVMLIHSMLAANPSRASETPTSLIVRATTFGCHDYDTPTWDTIALAYLH